MAGEFADYLNVIENQDCFTCSCKVGEWKNHPVQISLQDNFSCRSKEGVFDKKIQIAMDKQCHV